MWNMPTPKKLSLTAPAVAALIFSATAAQAEPAMTPFPLQYLEGFYAVTHTVPAEFGRLPKVDAGYIREQAPEDGYDVIQLSVRTPSINAYFQDLVRLYRDAEGRIYYRQIRGRNAWIKPAKLSDDGYIELKPRRDVFIAIKFEDMRHFTVLEYAPAGCWVSKGNECLLFASWGPPIRYEFKLTDPEKF